MEGDPLYSARSTCIFYIVNVKGPPSILVLTTPGGPLERWPLRHTQTRLSLRRLSFERETKLQLSRVPRPRRGLRRQVQVANDK